MKTRITSTTNLHEISVAAQGANDSRHVRGITVDGARAIYVNKSFGDKVEDIFKRLFGIGPSQAQQREDGARAVREALINQFGVAVADRVLSNVAERTNRNTADLMRQGITTKELHQIEDNLVNGKNDDGLRIIDSSADATRRAAAKRRMSDKVNVAIMGWTGAEAPKGKTDMARAGRAYRALSGMQQDFVHRRLHAILRYDIENGVPVDEKKIAKVTLKLARQATSGTFDALSKKWAEIDAAAGELMGSVRSGDAAKLVGDAVALGKSAHGTGSLEDKADGISLSKIDNEDNVEKTDVEYREKKYFSRVGVNEVQAFAREKLDDQITGKAPVDAQAAYRRAMGTRGSARSVLLASHLISMMGNNKVDRHRDYINSFATQGVKQAVLALAAKGNVADVAAELNAVRDAWTKAMNEYCALTLEERQSVEQWAKLEVEQKFGSDDPGFDKEYRAALKRTHQKKLNAKKQWFHRTLMKKGLNSGEDEVVRFMDVVLSKAGVAEKDPVLKAYNGILSAARTEELQGRVYEYDGDIYSS